MIPRQPFRLVYDPDLVQHLKAVNRKHHPLIRRTIEEQLRHEPDIETRNRKPLRRPSALGTAWELRFGPNNRFRVFYRSDTSVGEVHILAFGVKVRDRLFVGGQEFKL